MLMQSVGASRPSIRKPSQDGPPPAPKRAHWSKGRILKGSEISPADGSPASANGFLKVMAGIKVSAVNNGLLRDSAASSTVPAASPRARTPRRPFASAPDP